VIFSESWRWGSRCFLFPSSPRTILKFFCHRSESRTDLEKKDQDEMQMKLAKRRSQLMEVEDLDRPLDAALAKPSLQTCPQHMTCGYCLKPGTYNTTARKVMNYVVYVSEDQLKSNCSFKETENITSIWLTHQVSPLEENSRPTGRVNSLHPPTSSISQVQKRSRTRAHGKRRQTYNQSDWRGSQDTDGVRTGKDAQYLKKEPWKY